MSTESKRLGSWAEAAEVPKAEKDLRKEAIERVVIQMLEGSKTGSEEKQKAKRAWEFMLGLEMPPLVRQVEVVDETTGERRTEQVFTESQLIMSDSAWIPACVRHFVRAVPGPNDWNVVVTGGANDDALAEKDPFEEDTEVEESKSDSKELVAFDMELPRFVKDELLKLETLSMPLLPGTIMCLYARPLYLAIDSGRYVSLRSEDVPESERPDPTVLLERTRRRMNYVFSEHEPIWDASCKAFLPDAHYRRILDAASDNAGATHVQYAVHAFAAITHQPGAVAGCSHEFLDRIETVRQANTRLDILEQEGRAAKTLTREQLMTKEERKAEKFIRKEGDRVAEKTRQIFKDVFTDPAQQIFLHEAKSRDEAIEKGFMVTVNDSKEAQVKDAAIGRTPPFRPHAVELEFGRARMASKYEDQEVKAEDGTAKKVRVYKEPLPGGVELYLGRIRVVISRETWSKMYL